MTKTEFMPVDTEEQLSPLNEDGGVDSTGKKAVKKRQGWDSKWQYIFMVISYAVGLGNVWRFPYLVQQNGGGAFLIPYLIMLFIEGMPLLYLEFAIGQRLQKGTVIVWNEINPLLGGIGIASAVTSFNLAIYYNGVITWCFFYLFHSFQYPLPWATCPTETVLIGNTSKEVDIEECAKGGATSYFWYRRALDVSPGIDSPEGIKWKMLLCLLFAWIIVYACIWKGIKSSGKVVYFTATFPYIVLIIFFVRGVTLRGAVDGLAHMYTPKLERLLEPRVWLDAATQIFFSFGLGFGGLISFSSYNNIHNNCQRDTILISLTNWFTAIFASSVVFAVLGFKATLMMENCVEHNFLMWQETFPTMANISQEVWQTTYAVNLTAEVQNVWNCSLAKFLDEAASGTGLAFIIFTQAIVEFGPSAPFWSIIFFMMLLSLGMGSEFGTIEGFTASIYDLEPLPFITRRKWLVSAIICGSSFLIGLLFVLGSGSYWVALFDQFSASFPLLLIAMMECVTIGWIYGVNKFGDDIEFMIGSQPNIYWKIIWKFVAPIMVAGLLVATLISYFIEPLKYEAYDALTATMIPRDYPWYGVVIAFILVLSSVGCIPVIAILRRLKILNWNYAKQIQAEEKGYTQSTAKFLRSATSVDDDNDGRSGEEAIVRPYTDNPDVRKHSTQDGAVTFTFKE
ncbi:sodium- and chloride-dependent transporter XTRP3-like [Dreissena polymorpha]|uniref:sodium- and chloride-dependent transporter XTRP3-like n=1 Tax=Dreissena polymorpha TaxID=45954 RepID=UPI002265493C|nr:sodium- and chloride-dependent transporter XTRP3-like [Dreissena polymorpha]